MTGGAPPAGDAGGSPSPQRGQGGLGGLGEGSVGNHRGAQGSGYAPADSLGNFRAPTDSDTTDSGQPRIDYDELEYDPSERRPGGPVAEAIWAAGPQARRVKWALPAVAFLAALLLQSAGLHAATQRYVKWMEHLGQRVEGASTVPADLLGPRDRLVSWLGHADTSKLPLDFTAGAVPLVWLGVVLGQRNIRLWTHTLLAGTIIALLKGLCAWVTVVPDPPGSESCFERLHPQVLSHFQHHDSIWETVPIILWLWMQDLIFGMRNQQRLVCAGGLSGPSYACALFSMGLYDASRSRVRKMKPHFRTMYHTAAAFLLSSIVLADAGLDLATHRQSTLDVVLALVLALLLYGSPVVAMATDRFLLEGCPVEADMKVGCDIGDVVVPPCCLPFCCLHGRYFLHTWPASEVREALRAQAEAKRASEEFRIEQQEAARVSLELEAQLDGVRSRSQARRRQDESEAERRFMEQAAEAQQASERRLAQELADLEAEMQAERRKVAECEERSSSSARRLQELEAQQADECRRLEEDLAKAKKEADEAKAALKLAKEQAIQQALDVTQLRQSVAELGPEALEALEEAEKADSALEAGETAEAVPAETEALKASAPAEADIEAAKASGAPEGELAAAAAKAAPIESEEPAPAPSPAPAAAADVPAAATAAEAAAGDFRSLPPEAWEACLRRFPSPAAAAASPALAAAAGAAAPAPAPAAAPAPTPAPAPEPAPAPSPGPAATAEVPAAAAAAGAAAGDFRSLPPEAWEACLRRFPSPAAAAASPALAAAAGAAPAPEPAAAPAPMSPVAPAEQAGDVGTGEAPAAQAGAAAAGVGAAEAPAAQAGVAAADVGTTSGEASPEEGSSVEV